VPDGAEDDLRARLDEFVGEALGSGAPAVAPDPVNEPMIRHWCAALEDDNPVYTDPEFAASTRWGGVVAPPLMLQTWTMATPEVDGIAERGGSPLPVDHGTGPIGVLDEAGYVATLAANSEFEIERYLRPGERLTSSIEIESISDEKQTRIGPGFFVTWVTTYHDEAGDVVGRQRFRILKFKPELG
jgi:uncharacterized protein